MKFLFLIIACLLCFNCSDRNNEEREILSLAIKRSNEYKLRQIFNYKAEIDLLYSEQPEKFQSLKNTVEDVTLSIEKFQNIESFAQKKDAIIKLRDYFYKNYPGLDIIFYSAEKKWDAKLFDILTESDIIDAEYKVYESIMPIPNIPELTSKYKFE